MSDFQRPQNQSRPKTMLNDYTQPHPETEQPLQGAKHNGALRFEQKINGDIVLRVFDGIWSQEKRVTREVMLNYNERGVLFDTIRQAADMSTPFSSAQLPINQNAWVRGNDGKSKRTDEPVNSCNFIISRDEKGRVTLTYQKGDYSFKTVFRMANVAAMRVKNPDGTTTEDFGMPSRASARAWCNFHEELLNDLEWKSWKPKGGNNANAGGGQGGGNNNWQNRGGNNNGGGNSGGNAGGGNGGGSMNATTQEFDDDIEW